MGKTTLGNLVMTGTAIFLLSTPMSQAQTEPDRTSVQVRVKSADEQEIGLKINVKVTYSNSEIDNQIIDADGQALLILKECNDQVRLGFSVEHNFTHMSNEARCIPNPIEVFLTPIAFAMRMQPVTDRILQAAIDDMMPFEQDTLLSARREGADYDALLARAYLSGNNAGMAYIANEAAWANRGTADYVGYMAISTQAGVTAMLELSAIENGAPSSAAALMENTWAALDGPVLSDQGLELLKQFQADSGVPQTGRIDPKTMDALSQKAFNLN